MSINTKLLVIAFFTAATIAAVLLMHPVAQDPSYHNFADQRSWLGIANFMDVVSNLPFIVVGIYGLAALRRYSAGKLTGVYACLFAGIMLVGIGSGYYHFAPTNETLVWDRIPMTLVFMSLLSAIVAERINEKAGKALLLPLLVTGIASVWWWYHTEQQGAGDLRAYAWVQFYPAMFIPLIMLLFRSSSHSNAARQLAWIVIAYALAKVCEHFDDAIFSFTGFISGHSLKHIAAAAATFFIVRMYTGHYSALPHVQRS